MPARLWAPVFLYVALIVTASSIPASAMPAGRIWSFDKIVHAVEYAILAALLGRAFLGHRVRPPRALILAALCAASVGVLDEIYQSFTPGRASSPFDALADLTGAILGATLVVLASQKKETRHGHRS